MNVDGPFHGVGVFAAAAVEQFVAGECSSRLTGERPEEPELGGGELEFGTVADDNVIGAIDFDAFDAHLVAGFGGSVPAAKQGLDALDEGFDAEGFGDVVVRRPC